MRTTGLLSNCTFANLVSGRFNELAILAGLTVSKHPSAAYNPLFIYGKNGLGKTHLLHSIGNKIQELHPKKIIKYTTAQDINEDFTNYILRGELNFFLRDCIKYDVLIIDNIEELKGKEIVQERLTNLFVKMAYANKQVIIASNVNPNKTDILYGKMLNHCLIGLVASIEEVDYEDRLVLLKELANIHKVDFISETSIRQMAKSPITNVSKLICVVKQLAFETKKVELGQERIEKIISFILPSAGLAPAPSSLE